MYLTPFIYLFFVFNFSYRFYQSNRACLKSIFALHNETINIWSHLLGFIFFAGLGVHAFNVSSRILRTGVL
jgi:predicted membrane channel-forming protein YqfA (hemolysin III family)